MECFICSYLLQQKWSAVNDVLLEPSTTSSDRSIVLSLWGLTNSTLLWNWIKSQNSNSSIITSWHFCLTTISPDILMENGVVCCDKFSRTHRKHRSWWNRDSITVIYFPSLKTRPNTRPNITVLNRFWYMLIWVIQTFCWHSTEWSEY
jgi:hypothetical protein